MCLAYASGNEATDFVEISDGLLLFAIGAVAGPLITFVLMDQFGTGHVFVFTSVVHGVMALWTYWRTRRRNSSRRTSAASTCL